jgi:uncharacterized protein (TIGR03083 family)
MTTDHPAADAAAPFSVPSLDRAADQIRTATSVLTALARQFPTAVVPRCPGWDVTELAGHLGQVQRWVTHVLATRAHDRPAAGSTERAPSERSVIADWVDAGVGPLVDALQAVGADTTVWNFAGLAPVSSFWWRRMVNEAWVHAIDGAAAVGSDQTMPLDVAVDVVDEFLALLPGRKLAAIPDASIGGSLHLHATDDFGTAADAHLSGEWMIELEGGTLRVDHGHGKGAAAVRGRAHDLALFVWGRESAADSTRFEVFGDQAVVTAWEAIGAF